MASANLGRRLAGARPAWVVIALLVSVGGVVAARVSPSAVRAPVAAVRASVPAAGAPASSSSWLSPSAVGAPSRTDASIAHVWPTDPGGPAWFGAHGMHLQASHPGRFVTARAPLDELPDDVVVSARFRKLGGPPGGGYGVIVRDQSSASSVSPDDQVGAFLVAEVGDRGEFGVWQRQGDRWLDLVPWTASDAVQRGGAPNDLRVRLASGRVEVSVNNSPLTTVDTGLSGGRVGAFVGGDLNDVVLERFALEPLTPADVAAPPPPVVRTLSAAAAAPDWSPPRLPVRLDPQALDRVRALVAGIADDMSSIAHSFLDKGIDDPSSPLHDPVALRRASERFDAAQQKAVELAAELDRLRSTDEDTGAR